MNLYSAVLSAWRTVGDEPRVYLTPGVVFAADEHDAQQRGLSAALRCFPESEGWFDHQVGAMAIPSPFDLEGYRLTWQIEERP